MASFTVVLPFPRPRGLAAGCSGLFDILLAAMLEGSLTIEEFDLWSAEVRAAAVQVISCREAGRPVEASLKFHG